MAHYIAFLRGVNVAGKWVKMEDVRKRMGSAGYENVETFIQSGNIFFESTNKDVKTLQSRIGKEISGLMGSPVTAIVFPLVELQVLLKANPFSKFKTKSEDKKWVVFLKDKPDKYRLPLFSTQRDVEVFYCNDRFACGVSRKNNGKYDYPTALIESKWKVQSTTRFWHTFEDMMVAFKELP
jgi:uncharacterized protein (DUF1697 family)